MLILLFLVAKNCLLKILVKTDGKKWSRMECKRAGRYGRLKRNVIAVQRWCRKLKFTYDVREERNDVHAAVSVERC